MPRHNARIHDVCIHVICTYHMYAYEIYACIQHIHTIYIDNTYMYTRTGAKTTFRDTKLVAEVRNMLQCATVCWSMLQYVAVCCSMLQHVAVCCSVLQLTQSWASNSGSHAIPCSALHCVAVCCNVLQCVAVDTKLVTEISSHAIGCSVLLCVVVCCSVLQYITVCCSGRPTQNGAQCSVSQF